MRHGEPVDQPAEPATADLRVPADADSAQITQPVSLASAAGLHKFLMHLFPLGHLPVPRSTPARQLPAPASFAAGLRFPPLLRPAVDPPPPAEPDSPGSPDSPGGGAAAGPDAVAGAAAVALPASHPEVVRLCADYDPLGGTPEEDWRRRFLVRPAGHAGRGAEYAWPPPELYPEGALVDAPDDVGVRPAQTGAESGARSGADAENPSGASEIVLPDGVELDRFGGPEGRVLFDASVPFEHRSVPPAHLTQGYHRYRVLRPLPVWRSVAAPWFGQPGGATRYRTGHPLADLVALGYLAVAHTDADTDADQPADAEEPRENG